MALMWRGDVPFVVCAPRRVAQPATRGVPPAALPTPPATRDVPPPVAPRVTPAPPIAALPVHPIVHHTVTPRVRRAALAP